MPGTYQAAVLSTIYVMLDDSNIFELDIALQKKKKKKKKKKVNLKGLHPK
jgi:hypothetical protein